MSTRRSTATFDPDGICSDCGQPHVTRWGKPSCHGHVRYDRDSYVPGQDRTPLEQPRPCRNTPITGTTRCKSHGSGSEQVKQVGQQREQERKAAMVLRRFGEQVDTTPTEALLDAVKWTAGYVAWLREKVAGDAEQATDPAARAAGDEKALTQLSTHTGKREAGVWVELLGQWHDRLVRICSEAIKAGIEERRVRIAEQQGALVADVIRKILGDLDLTAEQVSKAGEVVPFRLRALAS